MKIDRNGRPVVAAGTGQAVRSRNDSGTQRSVTELLSLAAEPPARMCCERMLYRMIGTAFCCHRLSTVNFVSANGERGSEERRTGWALRLSLPKLCLSSHGHHGN